MEVAVNSSVKEINCLQWEGGEEKKGKKGTKLSSILAWVCFFFDYTGV